MNNTWIYFNGAQKIDYTSFPLAFRAMFYGVNPRPPQKEGEVARTPIDRTKCKIISPLKKEYSYSSAYQLAESQGLITPEGQINSKEFKKR